MDFSKLGHDSNSDDDSLDNVQKIDQEMVSDHESDTKEEDESEDDESEDDESEDDEQNFIVEINRLQEELGFNPNDYEKYIKLIGILRTVGELKHVREIREKMNEIYPLSPKIWSEWIEDEVKVASTDNEKHGVIALYKRAIKDYLDKKIWADFVEYSIDLNKKSLLPLEETREILIQSLHHIGCSVSDGVFFWRKYREFEISELIKIPKESEDEIQKQVKIICQLYQRQFSLPLLGMEEDYQNFEQWLKQIKADYNIEQINIKSEYEKSLKSLEPLRKYEFKLQQATSPRLEEYMAYINFELKNDNLARTQCLFERALTENCLQSDLWLKYLKYCDDKIVVQTLLMPIYKRASENCPWVAKIWIKYMLANERLGQCDDVALLKNSIFSLMEKALNSCNSIEDHREIWTTYLTFLRRTICRTDGWGDEEQTNELRKTFERAIQNIENKSDIEFCYDLYRYSAKVEAKFFKNIQNFRSIWKKLLNESSNFKKQASFWLDYANMEMMLGNHEEYRKILLKGLNMCSDYPEYLGDALLRYELEEGNSITQYQESLSKFETILIKFNEKRWKQAEKEKYVKTEEVPLNSRPLKRKVEDDSQKNEKKLKNELNSTHGVTVKTDESKREQTVYLSNLSFDLTETEIQDIFLQFGSINEVRLVRNYKGLSKGFCYVEYEKIEFARKALMHDRMLIHGRPVYISEMDKKKKFSYSLNQEKNKVFVKNIPPELTKEDLLSKVFKNYSDSIVDVRLVTFRNGLSKGLAYLEMANINSAEKIVNEMNDFSIGDKKLFVAISNPSLAKSTGSVNTTKPSKFGVSSMMVPHSVSARAHPSKVKIQIDTQNNTNEIADTESISSENSNQNQSKSMSNDKFRSMFFK